mmetsp:Transcript_15667/g.61238  ORF Transcript_15667/g.61238 Transcript_15667/m.61238 type:complete len:218 (+) Transcript_15667:1747-2400(+)
MPKTHRTAGKTRMTRPSCTAAGSRCWTFRTSHPPSSTGASSPRGRRSSFETCAASAPRRTSGADTFASGTGTSWCRSISRIRTGATCGWGISSTPSPPRREAAATRVPTISGADTYGTFRCTSIFPRRLRSFPSRDASARTCFPTRGRCRGARRTGVDGSSCSCATRGARASRSCTRTRATCTPRASSSRGESVSRSSTPTIRPSYTPPATPGAARG